MTSDNNTQIADVALQPYWEAAQQGRLLIQQCQDCEARYYYPRPLCPKCLSSNTEWLETSGGGSIYAYSTERRADPPYVIAFVTLDEGPSLMTNIVDCEFESLSIGQRVELRFETRDERPVPVFVPA